MNRNQKIVIGVGVLIILIMGLFPPWVITSHVEPASESRISMELKYAPIFKIPTSEAFQDVLGFRQEAAREQSPRASDWDSYILRWREEAALDVSRLLIQWVTLVMGVVGLVLILKETDRR